MAVSRIATLGDIHFGPEAQGTLRPMLQDLPDAADLLLIAGDVTPAGQPNDARPFVEELTGLRLPIVAVLGDHDYHAVAEDAIRQVMTEAGIQVPEGETTIIDIGRCQRLGIAGTKGFGGGFHDAAASDYGEREQKAFVRHTKTIVERLERILAALPAGPRIVLLHYAPIEDILRGERPEIYPFLGSSLLADAVDRPGADLILHGHAHGGCEGGTTQGGVPVWNVARSVIKRPYVIYHLEPDRDSYTLTTPT